MIQVSDFATLAKQSVVLFPRMRTLYKIGFLILVFFWWSTDAFRIKRQEPWVWGEEDQQDLSEGGRPLPRRGPFTTQPSLTATQQSEEFNACVKNCPATRQYSPVCGSNQVTYVNIAKLTCARKCGLNVRPMLDGACTNTG